MYMLNTKMYIRQSKTVLNCHLSPPSCTILAMMHVYGAADGGNFVCQGVPIAVILLPSHIVPCHASLSQPVNTRVWEDCLRPAV